MRKLLCRGFLLLLACPSWVAAATYTAYNTYLHPPFVQPDGNGLAAELVQALNRHMGEDQFVLQNVPRARFLAMARHAPKRIDGIALFLSPTFLKSSVGRRYGWSAPLFLDHNVLVFKAGNVPGSPMPGSLRGLRFGAVRGHVYRFLDDMERRGELVVDEVGDEMNNLRKLIAGRIDFTVVNRLHFRALAEHSPELQQLVATPEPGGDFTRHLLQSPRLPPATAKRLAVAVQALQRDPEWQAVLARYGAVSATATSG
jgi:polar amino acid transport system substrate-binding protein